MILTKKGAISTSKEALMEIDSEFSNFILRYRELHKLCNTYLNPIYENLDQDNRIHAMFNQGATVTGRFSSSNPINLQNIPSRTLLGKKVRELFISRENYKLLILDFSQIELRLLAHFSQDKRLLNAYKEGVDVHEQTAKAIFNTENPTKDERFIGKTINFSVSYGAGYKKVAQIINLSGLNKRVTENESRVLLDRFNSLYPGINSWKRSVWYNTKHSGIVKTLLGRVIPIAGFKGTYKEEAQAQRDSVSYLIQGSAADIMKKSISDVVAIFPLLRLIATVHDEILIEISQEDIEFFDKNYLNTPKKIMESSVTLSIPLEVNAKIAANWGEK